MQNSPDLDDTYKAQNAPVRYAEGMRIYNELLEGRDWSTVPGWFNYWQFYQLTAQNLKDGDVVAEIGVLLGRSIIYLAQECKRLGKKVKFIAIDNFEGEKDQPEHDKLISAIRIPHSAIEGKPLRQAFEANIKRCGVADMITVIEGDSAKMSRHIAPQSLSFCFIDAAHDYHSVRRDIAAWLPKMKTGHCIAGHDAEWEGVKQAVTERFGKSALFFGCIWMAKA